MLLALTKNTKLRRLLIIYYYYFRIYLLKFSFHSVAVVLTVVQIKLTRITKHKQTAQYPHIHTHITKPTHTHTTHYKTHTYIHTHTLQNPHVHTPTLYQTHTYTHTLQNPHIHTPTHYNPRSHARTHARTPTHYKTSSNNHSTRYTPKEIVTIQSIKYPQYKVTLTYMVLLSPSILT